MTTTINNEWIPLPIQRNGVVVQRKFAGLDTDIDENNKVLYCNVKYWERELYPNGEVNKIEKKHYVLVDLPETINDVEGWRQEPQAVLTGFINALGYPGIINPARETLENILLLAIDAPNGYALRLDTREKLPLITE
jgi:hypothetical protein